MTGKSGKYSTEYKLAHFYSGTRQARTSRRNQRRDLLLLIAGGQSEPRKIRAGAALFILPTDSVRFGINLQAGSSFSNSVTMAHCL